MRDSYNYDRPHITFGGCFRPAGLSAATTVPDSNSYANRSKSSPDTSNSTSTPCNQRPETPQLGALLKLFPQDSQGVDDMRGDGEPCLGVVSDRETQSE